jgi:CRP-like cAMP-binding protein
VTVALWAEGVALVILGGVIAADLYFFHRPGDHGGLTSLPRHILRRPHPESTPAFTFWGALTRTEQHVLRSVARRRTYPPGAVIFHEGRPADHVVVIRSGWTKICVHEDGEERILAERGPGELIGERAALQADHVRSATVVAVETVHALVVRTPVFANFISRYPRVLGIVEHQVYDRLTQTPGRLTQTSGRLVHDGGRAAPQTRPAGAPSSADSPDGALPRLNGHSCTIVMTDIAKFNAPYRTADDRLLIQHKSFTMTRDAFVQAGIPWNECHRRDLGDGMQIVVPPTIPPATVMRALSWLGGELATYNRRSSRAVQIQLRAAVHLGPVTTSAFGLAGETLILASRLLDAAALKRQMADTGAALGVIASDHIYETIIKDLDRDGYRKLRCKVKESRLTAWIKLTGSALPPA